MSAITKIFAQVLSVLIIAGMFTGIYNPCVEPFEPPVVNDPAYEGETLTIIEDGLSDYVIFVGEYAGVAGETAATKLQGFLEQISGARLEVCYDVPAGKKCISILGEHYWMGDQSAAITNEEGFRIGTINDGIFIESGGPRGTLYGVYAFLEKFLGCRWYSKDTKIIPKNSTVKVPAEIWIEEAPAFKSRASTIVQGGYDIDSALANRVNDGWEAVNLGLDRPEYGGVCGWTINHEVEGVLGVAGQLEAHPEIFAKGEDGVTPYGGYTNPCLTGPVGLFVEYAVRKIDAGARCVSFGLNNSGDICRCAVCKAVYAEEAAGAAEHDGFSGAYVRWLNKICEALAAKGEPYASTKISGFGYAITEAPPKTPCHENILIYFCPIGMCYAHTLADCTQEETHATFDVNFKGWAEKSRELAIFEYPITYDHYGIPYPIWGAMQSYIQLYRASGVTGFINCTNCMDDSAFYQMTGYLYARLLWDPDADMDALLDAFLPVCYGKGWQYIREYIRVTSEDLTGRTIGGVQYHTQCQNGATPIGNLAMTNNQLKYIDALWAKAKELSASQPRQLLNIRRAEVSWRIWKADNFRGEFWFFNFPFTRTKSSKALFEDILALDVTMHDQSTYYFGSPRDVWPAGHEKAGRQKFDKKLFYDLYLYVMWPRYWSSRQFGGDAKMEEVDNLWEMITTLVF